MSVSRSRIEEALIKPRRVVWTKRQEESPIAAQVERQIGRILGKNSRAAGLFDVKVAEMDRRERRRIPQGHMDETRKTGVNGLN